MLERVCPILQLSVVGLLRVAALIKGVPEIVMAPALELEIGRE